MWIPFPKIQKEDCAKKSVEANIRALRLSAISTMCEPKALSWIERKRKLSKQFLNFTPKATLGLKMSRTFWRNAEYFPAAERESTRRGRLLSFPIRFTLGYSNMAVSSTRESTSQSSQRNFLIRRKKF